MVASSSTRRSPTAPKSPGSAGSRRAGPTDGDARLRVPAELDTSRDRRRLERERRRRILALVLLLGCALLVAYDVVRPGGTADPAVALPGSPSPGSTSPGSPPPGSATPGPTPPATSAAPAVTVVNPGAGTFSYAGAAAAWTGPEGPVYGLAGTLNRYRVAVEDGLGITPVDFAARVDEVLGDQRSWIAGNTVRFQRVAGFAPANFTVFLASPATSQQMCRADGIETDQFTNCRLAGKIVINSARWLTAVPDYGAPLAVYQAYAVNHEVGHQLGWWHEDCPGPGQPAPVMQQQTLGLHGCVANSWPYLDGVRYRGPTAAV